MSRLLSSWEERGIVVSGRQRIVLTKPHALVASPKTSQSVDCEASMTVDRGEVHAVLFDLDHTLWERDAAIRRLVTAQYAGFAALAAVPRDEYVERVLMLDDHGTADKKAIYEQVVREFDLQPSLAEELRTHFWRTSRTTLNPFLTPSRC